MKLKLKPNLRINRRHIYLEGLKDEVEQAILDYIGILGWAKASPIFLNDENNLVLSIDRKMINDVRAAIELCNYKIKIKKISGTLKGLEK